MIYTPQISLNLETR
ncbi:putative 60S ribosomal protein L39-like 5 [Columba livia]|uniref:Putative 60S ribosomal protein L39-like 5 n=1 Tax=Columba livia TaxID=8932 RepID=A0A2I0MLB1_COLLI|nr:putative 60S ribosomal protein L39-like 5 [Columba livia]